MVNLSTDQERKRRGEPLFQQHPDLALAIHLTPESGHPELVLGSQSRRGLPLARSHRTGGGVQDLEVQTDIHGGGELLVIRRLKDSLRLQLDGSDPLVQRVETQGSGRGNGDGRAGSGKGGELGEVAGGGLKDLGLRVLDQGLETESETRGDRVQEGDHVDSGKVGGGGIDRSQVERVVRTDMVVLDLNHRVSGLARQLCQAMYMSCSQRDDPCFIVGFCLYPRLTCACILVVSLAPHDWFALAVTDPV